MAKKLAKKVRTTDDVIKYYLKKGYSQADAEESADIAQKLREKRQQQMKEECVEVPGIVPPPDVSAIDQDKLKDQYIADLKKKIAQIVYIYHEQYAPSLSLKMNSLNEKSFYERQREDFIQKLIDHVERTVYDHHRMYSSP